MEITYGNLHKGVAYKGSIRHAYVYVCGQRRGSSQAEPPLGLPSYPRGGIRPVQMSRSRRTPPKLRSLLTRTGRRSAEGVQVASASVSQRAATEAAQVEKRSRGKSSPCVLSGGVRRRPRPCGWDVGVERGSSLNYINKA